MPPVTEFTRAVLRAKVERLERADKAAGGGQEDRRTKRKKKKMDGEVVKAAASSSPSARAPVATFVFVDLEATGLAASRWDGWSP